jgi:hypothetical protein
VAKFCPKRNTACYMCFVLTRSGSSLQVWWAGLLFAVCVFEWIFWRSSRLVLSTTWQFFSSWNLTWDLNSHIGNPNLKGAKCPIPFPWQIEGLALQDKPPVATCLGFEWNIWGMAPSDSLVFKLQTFKSKMFNFQKEIINMYKW